MASKSTKSILSYVQRGNKSQWKILNSNSKSLLQFLSLRLRSYESIMGWVRACSHRIIWPNFQVRLLLWMSVNNWKSFNLHMHFYFILSFQVLSYKYIIISMILSCCYCTVVFVSLWDHVFFHFIIRSTKFIQMEKFNRQSLERKGLQYNPDTENK